MKKRILKNTTDLFAIENISYNDHAGTRKVSIVEPVVKKAVTSTDVYPEGSLVKVTGTSYTLKLLNKDFNAADSYVLGQLMAKSGKVYEANEPVSPGAFDVSQWNEVSDAVIGPVTVSAGAVVCCGKFHNNVGVAGFLIEDESVIM